MTNHSGTTSYKTKILVRLIDAMKKIDILNFITDFRKAPNDIKTLSQLVNHLGTDKEAVLVQMLEELKQARVVRESQIEGERAYQVIAR